MKVPVSGKVYDNAEINNIKKAAEMGWWTEERFAAEFSKLLSIYISSKYAILCNSGSSANLLAISALKSEKLRDKQLRDGTTVATVAAGFPTTVAPILQNNLIPAYIDIDIGSYTPSDESLTKVLTGSSKAMILAHTLGNPFNIDLVKAICQEHDIWLVEDNCDALGSMWGQHKTGSFGDMATQSFFPAHHITTGEGGAVLTSNPTLKRIVESLKNWGRDCWCLPGFDDTCGKRFEQKLGLLPESYDHKYIYTHLGYNLKMTDLQAAIGVAQMDKLPKFAKIREKNFIQVFEFMKQYEEFFYLPKTHTKAHPSWFGFPLTIRETAPFGRTEIVSWLENHEIATRPLFGGNLLKHPAFRHSHTYIAESLKNTNIVMERGFWIGCWHGLSEEQISYMLEIFDSFMRIQ